MNRQLYKSNNNRIICGVCGGFGEYFNIDPLIVRLIVVLFTLCGAGLVFYIIAAVLMPAAPARYAEYQSNYGADGSSARYAGYEHSDQAYNEQGYSSQQTPYGSNSESMYEYENQRKGDENTGTVVTGIVLVALGCFIALRYFMPWISGSFFAAAALIGLGVYFLVKRS